jgi:hypothetical protein
MPFSSILDAGQLALLTRVLESFCDQQGIVDRQGREEAAFQILHIHQRGVDDEVALLTIMKAVYWQRQPPTS